MRAHHIKTLYCCRWSEDRQAVKHLEKSHIAQIFAKRKEVLSFRLPAELPAELPACCVPCVHNLLSAVSVLRRSSCTAFLLVLRYPFVTLPDR